MNFLESIIRFNELCLEAKKSAKTVRSPFDSPRHKKYKWSDTFRQMMQKKYNYIESIEESDEEIRRLERKLKADPTDRITRMKHNRALARAGKLRTPEALKTSFRISKDRADKIQKAIPGTNSFNNYRRFLRLINSAQRAKSRADELTGRATGNKKLEIAGGRSRKLNKVLNKHLKTMKGNSREIGTDDRYKRIEHLANRANAQATDASLRKRLGTMFKKGQDPERSSLLGLSSRTRRKHDLPSWKAKNQRDLT
jgi:hypothetical protein